jgi:hypothetical protein
VQLLSPKHHTGRILPSSFPTFQTKITWPPQLSLACLILRPTPTLQPKRREYISIPNPIKRVKPKTNPRKRHSELNHNLPFRIINYRHQRWPPRDRFPPHWTWSPSHTLEQHPRSRKSRPHLSSRRSRTCIHRPASEYQLCRWNTIQCRPDPRLF